MESDSEQETLIKIELGYIFPEPLYCSSTVKVLLLPALSSLSGTPARTLDLPSQPLSQSAETTQMLADQVPLESESKDVPPTLASSITTISVPLVLMFQKDNLEGFRCLLPMWVGRACHN